MPRIFYKQKKEDHEQDPGSLFDELACRRDLCALYAETVAADAAVDSGARQGVGDDDQQPGTPGIAEEGFCDAGGILLDQQDFSQRQDQSQAESDAEHIAGRLFLPL